MARPARDGRPGGDVPVLLSAALALGYLLWDPPSADLFAAQFRAWLFERDGWTLWNPQWYGGHHVLGYSVLAPPLFALLTPQVVGALSMVGATAAFTALARDRLRPAAAWAFAAVSVAPLLSGRLTFALGTAAALAALLALQRGRPALATALAVLTSLSSPVAALFLALAAAAVLGADRDRRAVAVGLGAVVPTGLVALAFPEDGTFPFVASSFWPTLAGAAAVAALLAVRGHRAPRALRLGAVLYVGLVAAAGAVPSALGGNAARLGVLLALPVVVGAAPRRLAAFAAVPLAFWAFSSAVDDVAQATRDPSTRAAFYVPLLQRLAAEDVGRLEIPFTDDHAEAFFAARAHPLARGWLRQTDRARNALFYDGRLTRGRYLAWLRETGTTHVALPAVPLDPSGAREADLLRAGVLPEIWRSRDWRLFAVPDPGPVRPRWSPYWTGCVRDDGGWTAGRPTGMRFALTRVGSRSPGC
jgi:hypothetical protein